MKNVKDIIQGNNNNLPKSIIPTIGSAYSTDMGMSTGQQCLKMLNTSLSYTDGGSSSLNIGTSIGYLELEADVTGSLTASLDILIAWASAGGYLLLAAQGGIYSQSYNFVQKMTFPTQIFNPVAFGTDALTPEGLAAYNAGPLMFDLFCGSQFVWQVDYGAGLYVTYLLDFVSWDVKLQFALAANVGVIFNIFDLSIFLHKFIDTTGIEGIATVLAYQYGGNYSALSEIFDENLGGLFFTACVFSKLEACDLVVNQTIDYSINNFPYQINMTADGQYTGNIAAIDFSYLPYSMLNLTNGFSSLTPEIISTRNNLSDMFDILQNQNDFVSHLLDSWPVQYMSSDVVAHLNATQTNITSNIVKLTNGDTGYINCYTSVQNCTESASELINSLNFIDSNFINGFTDAVSLQYVYCGDLNTGNINGVAIPLGNNNYIKIQSSNFKEMMQLSYDDNFMTIIEPNIGNGAGFKIALAADELGIYKGNSTFNGECIIVAVGELIDNPI